MKWFQHETNASLDAKLQEILLDYGLEGYGLYWYCLELIGATVTPNNITFELEHDARIIARNTGSTVQRVEEMMRKFVELGLFDGENGSIFCTSLMKRCDEYTQKLLRKSGINQDNVRMLSGQNPDSVGIKSALIEEKRREENIPGENRARFNPPDQEEIADYFLGKGSSKVEAEKFFYFYDSKNWMVGKNKMKSWKSSAAGWIVRNEKDKPTAAQEFFE